MKIDESMVKKAATLSYLDTEELDIQKYTNELSDIVNFFNILNDVDTENTKQLTNSTELEDVIYEDKPRACLNIELIKSNFPDSKNDYLKTKQIL